MKATVQRKEFSDALSLASSASSVRTALPVLGSIRLTAEGAGIQLLGCDGEMWAGSTIPANVESPGGICVQAGLLNSIVQVLADGEVSIELDGTSVFVRQSQSEFRLLALPAEEFPPIPAVQASSTISMPFGEFHRAISGVSYAVSDDMSRPVLTGVLFHYDGQTLTLVATDTHRLAVHRVHRDGIGSNINAIVPEKALRAIRSLPLDESDTITVSFDEARVIVDIGSAIVVSQLLSGQYPNWERVVPQEFTRTWTVDRQEFYDNVRRAMVLAKDNANRVRFSGRGDTVVISARSEDKGEAKEEVSCVARNGDLEIAFNGKYVMEALAAMGNDGVRAEMTEASRPAVLRPIEGGDDHYCVVMPMAIG